MAACCIHPADRLAVSGPCRLSSTYDDALNVRCRLCFTYFNHESSQLSRVDGNEDDAEATPYLAMACKVSTVVLAREEPTLPRKRLDQHFGDFVLNV